MKVLLGDHGNLRKTTTCVQGTCGSGACQWSDVAVGLAIVLARQGSFGVEALALLMCRQLCQIRDWINAVWHAVSCSCCSSGGWNLYCGWNLYTPVADQCQCGVMFIQVSRLASDMQSQHSPCAS